MKVKINKQHVVLNENNDSYLLSIRLFPGDLLQSLCKILKPDDVFGFTEEA